MINFNNSPIFKLAYSPSFTIALSQKNGTSIDQKQEDLIQQQSIVIKNQLVWEVVSTSFVEMGVGLLTTGAACCFIATPWIPTVLTTTVICIAITTLLHSIEAYFNYQLSCELLKKNSEKDQDIIHLAEPKAFTIATLHYFIRPFPFAILNDVFHGTLVHECGHAIAASILFENSNSKIEIYPFQGGLHSFKARYLSPWGEMFGRQRSLTIVTAAGPIFAIFEATFFVAASHLVKDSHPQLRVYLLQMSFQRICKHVAYALSALMREARKSKNHDFYQLWQRAGIHPLAAATMMIAIPLFTQLALWKWDAMHHEFA